MALIEKIEGTQVSSLQFSFSGPRLKANAGTLQARNAADSAFAKIKCATPTSSNDLINLAYMLANSASAVDGVTKAVPGDFATPQLAVDFFKNKILGNNNKVTLAAGSYATNIDVSNLNGELTIEGDTRTIAGQIYHDGLTINTDSVDGGAGIATISVNVGLKTLTLTATSTVPDFATAGVVPGDLVFIPDNGATPTQWIFIVDAVAANVITLTTTPPAIVPSFVISPNRKLDAATILTITESKSTLKFKGIALHSNIAASKVLDISTGKVKLQNSLLYSEAVGSPALVSASGGEVETIGFNNSLIGGDGILSNGNSFLNFDYSSLFFGRVIAADGNISLNNGRCFLAGSAFNIVARNSGVIDCNDSYANTASNVAYLASSGGKIYADGAYATVKAGVFSAQTGFLAERGGKIYANNAFALGVSAGDKFTVAGFMADAESTIYAVGATANYCATGYKAQYTSYINAAGTSGNNIGNTTDYSPSVSDTPGNVQGNITFS